MSKKIVCAIVILFVGCGAFYGGIFYTKSKNPARGNFTRLGGADFANIPAGERQARMGQAGGAAGGRNGGGFVSGEIISKDDKSVTVKLGDARLPDGQSGSKIIFFSDSTKITKTVDGAAGDLKTGENITVSGDANSDGSVTAKTIQLRPALPVSPAMK